MIKIKNSIKSRKQILVFIRANSCAILPNQLVKIVRHFQRSTLRNSFIWEILFFCLFKINLVFLIIPKLAHRLSREIVFRSGIWVIFRSILSSWYFTHLTRIKAECWCRPEATVNTLTGDFTTHHLLNIGIDGFWQVTSLVPSS